MESSPRIWLWNNVQHGLAADNLYCYFHLFIFCYATDDWFQEKSRCSLATECTVNREEVEEVSIFIFVVTHISVDIAWTHNMTRLVKESKTKTVFPKNSQEYPPTSNGVFSPPHYWVSSPRRSWFGTITALQQIRRHCRELPKLHKKLATHSCLI